MCTMLYILGLKKIVYVKFIVLFARFENNYMSRFAYAFNVSQFYQIKWYNL